MALAYGIMPAASTQRASSCPLDNNRPCARCKCGRCAMAERDAIHLNLGDGFSLIAAGVRRERSGHVTADLILENGKVLFADRATLNTPEGRNAWAAKATGSGRPAARRMAEAICEYLLPEALKQL